MDRPPTSRGGHRRLNSIENDDWSERDDDDHDERKGPLQPRVLEERYAAGRQSKQSTLKSKQTKGETDNGVTSERKNYFSAVKAK